MTITHCETQELVRLLMKGHVEIVKRELRRYNTLETIYFIKELSSHVPAEHPFPTAEALEKTIQLIIDQEI